MALSSLEVISVLGGICVCVCLREKYGIAIPNFHKSFFLGIFRDLISKVFFEKKF